MLRLIVLVVMLLELCHVWVAAATKKTYIVHMAKSQIPPSFRHHAHWYNSSLKAVSDSAEMIYVYKTAIHGFSARLTAKQAKNMENQPGVVSVWPEMKYQLHTTRTPMFLGLEKTDGFLPSSAAESDVIIGVIDTGVWPEIKSFDDTGLGPVPSSWKGECEAGTNFTTENCNRKLIGARYFAKGYEDTVGAIDESEEFKSPRDGDGHGTHVASTAAGSQIVGASLFGYALEEWLRARE